MAVSFLNVATFRNEQINLNIFKHIYIFIEQGRRVGDCLNLSSNCDDGKDFGWSEAIAFRLFE